MITLAEIVDKDVKLRTLLSASLNAFIAEKNIKVKIVNDDEQYLLSEMDLLIEDTFPSEEAESYKPSVAFCIQKNPLCFVCLKNGVILGGGTVSFDFKDKSVTLISIAVDVTSRNDKIGSLLMLVLHDICLQLNITSISLISSPAGKAFYKSLGFAEKAHDSFECSIPFKENIIKRKLPSAGTNQAFMSKSIFKPKNKYNKTDRVSDEDATESCDYSKRKRIKIGI